jgi:hypothetical protein
MLLIEEIQSDWHQAGREKGYKSDMKLLTSLNSPDVRIETSTNGDTIISYKGDFVNGWKPGSSKQDMLTDLNDFISQKYGKAMVPDAPFKEDWYQLVLKRALQEAVDKGYDRVGLLTGARQADRYDLSKQVDSLQYQPSTQTLDAYKDGRVVLSKTVTEQELPGVIGKEAAKKLLETTPSAGRKQDKHELSGIDLKFGGEGMKKYYDEIYPGFLNKYGKKFDAKVGETTLKLTEGVPRKGISGESEPVRYIDITPKMKEALSRGQPMFKEGGLVSNTDTIKARLIEQGMPEDKAFMQALKLANQLQRAA